MTDPYHATIRSFLEEKGLRRGLDHMRQTLIASGDFRFEKSPKEEIYAFATPLLLTQDQSEGLFHGTQRVVRALEETGSWLRSHPLEARERLRLFSDMEEEFFALDPGFSEHLPIHRLDFAFSPHSQPQLLEVNCGCPGGELDPALVAGAFLASPLAQGLNAALSHTGHKELSVEFQDPRNDSLTTLMRIYQAFGRIRPEFPEQPTVALITTSAQAHFMLPECRGIARHYVESGYRTLIGDLLELEARGDQVRLRGEPIHLIFRKFSTQSFRRRMEDEDLFGREACHRVREVWEALSQRRLCMVNPLGSTWLQDKGLLEHIRTKCPELCGIVCETHILGSDFPATNPAIWKAICKGQEFILKRRHSFGGRHVILHPESVKARAPQIIREEPGQWVAQRRAPIPTYPFAIRDGHGIKVGAFPYTLSPFGRSCFVRVGKGGLHDPVNAHGVGAATCALVVGPKQRI